MDSLSAVAGSNSRFSPFVVGTWKGGSRCILCCRILCDFTFSGLGFFDAYFFRYSFVSDHFQYLASMGPLALAGAAITESFGQLAIASSLGRRVVFLRVGLCGILLILLAALTWQQSGVYHDLVTLYTRTLAKNPGCWMAHY